LSYTTFSISKLEVTPKKTDGSKPIKVQFFVENTGTRYGAEVPQVYLGLPTSLGEPPKRLVAFEKVWLNPGRENEGADLHRPRQHQPSAGILGQRRAELGDSRRRLSRVRGQFGYNIVLGDSITVRTPPGH
jgi:beta-glucosidase